MPDSGEFKYTELIAAFWRRAQDYCRKPDGLPTGELAPLMRGVANSPPDLRGLERHPFGPPKLQAVPERMIVAC